MGRTLARIALLAVQWLGLTVAIGATLVRADSAMVASIGGSVGLWTVGLVAIVAGLLLGLSVPDARLLYPLAFLMCAGAAGCLVLLVYSPAWAGAIERTVTLDNFATTRGVLYTGLLLLPVGIGALTGQLLSGSLATHGEILEPDNGEDAPRSWWD